MLRVAVLLLLLANAGFFAWSQGLLGAWGLAPAQHSEPQRLEQQINPQSLRILRDDEARGLGGQAVALGKAECLLAGPIGDAQLADVKQALQPWPAGSWSLEPVVEPGTWMLKLAAVDEALRPRLDELRLVLNATKLRPCR